MGDVQFDDESGEGDTMVVERERDLALSAQARQTVAEIDAALGPHRPTAPTATRSRRASRSRAERLEAIPWATVLVEEKVGGIGRVTLGRRPATEPPCPLGPRTLEPVPARCAAPVAIAVGVVVVDQLTQALGGERPHDPDRNIDVIWTLRFNLAFNTGMAFSRGTGLGPVIGILALLVVVGLLVSVGRSSSPLYPLAVGLIVGGALGNLARPAVPRRRAGSAAASSTSSTCSGGRSSTSPTSASPSAARC